MSVSTGFLTSREELMQVLQQAGFVYNPVSEDYADSGELSWPKAYESATAAHPTQDLEFGRALPANIEDKAIHIYTLDDDLYIEDMLTMTTAQVVGRIAAFVSGAYWSDVALG